ncbi:hypothetical protein [Burkholderia stagnalis]|uniref:Uncharacterized protein n=1 Tax=Burkholderia stagnalis TaxID=1503054 RepID=A0ABX9YDM2_9BURK|nr:hypothetical protein [Burkholderia stagnalis]RQQ42516.1 hypothetical protein DF158_36575 [Burkholderia stagnalis]RQQ56918.1 hypothetical protein DF137_36675 [Burkholderia stagnalis]RQQ57101.1 hypothetical protein DF139_36500 [Burkholderia stagnalis]RQQ69347.1 hypothetical protein DF138_36725 [Burkholderia stagnalis]RQQ76888.1 hypothetical protein DF134_37115 [Burkholderia stagnalis]
MRKLALLEKVSLIQRLRRTNGSALGIWVRKALMNKALSTHDYYGALIRLEQLSRIAAMEPIRDRRKGAT